MKWDNYFLNLCDAIAEKSPCLSRKVGAILVRDNSIVSTGYNGPPRKIPHCQGECPKRSAGLSGDIPQICLAQHAEENAVSNAARNGVSTLGCTLYINTVIPCQKCFGTLINAGIEQIVVAKLEWYDELSKILKEHSKIPIYQGRP